MTDFINTILTICGVGVACCCSLFLGLFFVLLSRGRIMMLPVVISLVYNFFGSILDGSFSLFNRNRMDAPLPPTGRTSLRSRAEDLKQRYDPLAEDDEGFTSQSARRRPSDGRFSSQSANRPRPSSGSSSSSRGGGLPPAPRPNLPRKGTPSDSGRSSRRSVDDDFDSYQPPSLRGNRRDTQRRRNRNDYDDEVMGGILGDDDDGWI